MQYNKQLIQSIHSKSKTGSNLRESDSELFFRLKDVRSQIREQDKNQGINAKRWVEFSLQCENLLVKKTKDLELLIWLWEAWVRIHQVSGFNAGLDLIVESITTYKHQLHPQFTQKSTSKDADSNTINYADCNSDDFNPWETLFSAVNGTESESIFLYPLQYISILDDAKNSISFLELKSLYQGNPSSAQHSFEKTVILDKSCYESIRVEWQLSIEKIENLEKILQKKPLNLLVSLNNLKTIIHDNLHCLEFYWRDYSAQVLINSELDEPNTEDISSSTLTSSAVQLDEVKSRPQAIQCIANAAEYFAHHEPHSPLASLLHKVIRWSKLSFSELLPELVNDPHQCEIIYQQMGCQSSTKEKI